VVPNTEFLFNDPGDSRAGPHVANEAETRRTPLQQLEQMLKLFTGEPRRLTMTRFGAKRILTLFTGDLDPLTDSGFGDSECVSDLYV
jgi:hypothetical protein